MIIYLHGFDSNSPGNHEKVLQLQFIDPDVRLISYSTRHPKHDMQHLLKEVDKMLQLSADDRPSFAAWVSVVSGRRELAFFAIFARPFSTPTCFLMKTWKARLTGRKSMRISPPSA